MSRAQEPLESLFARGTGELGFQTLPEISSQMVDLAKLLASWGERMNLTAHRGPDAILRRLILDAVALEACLPPLENLADVGSGPGFPGLPVAILRPERRVTLVESRERPHHFQRAAVRELGLRNVTTLRGRAESLEPVQHQAVVGQAVVQPDQVLSLMIPWAVPGGLLVLPGSEVAPNVPGHSGVDPQPGARYRVPLGGPQRTLWIGKKLS